MPIPMLIAALAVAGAAASATAALGAGGAPTIGVRVADDAIHLESPAALARGAVRLAFRRDGAGGPRSVAIVELRPGRTAADLAKLPLDGLVDAARLQSVGRLVGGTTARAGDDVKVTIHARARRHVVVDITDTASRSAEFAVAGAEREARAPGPDATIVLRDNAIRLPAALPRDGLVRVRNDGRRPHHALAIRLKAGLRAAEGLRRLRAGRRPGDVGAPVDLMGLLSPGIAADVERHLPRGRYLVVSFYAGAGPSAKPDILRGVAGTTRVR